MFQIKTPVNTGVFYCPSSHRQHGKNDSLKELNEQITAFKQALFALASNHSYKLGKREFVQTDTEKIRKTLEFLDRERSKVIFEAGPRIWWPTTPMRPISRTAWEDEIEPAPLLIFKKKSRSLKFWRRDADDNDRSRNKRGPCIHDGLHGPVRWIIGQCPIMPY